MTSKIEQQVMASVGVIYAARQLLSATAVKLYVCVLCLYGIAQLVWVERVWSNLAQVGLSGVGHFTLSALTHTDSIVQITLTALVVAGMSLLLDFTRTLASGRRFA